MYPSKYCLLGFIGDQDVHFSIITLVSSHLRVVPDVNCWLLGLVIFSAGWLLVLLASVAK